MNEEERKRKESAKEQKKSERAERAFVRWFAFLRFVAALLKVVFPYKRHDDCKDYGDRPYVFLCNHYAMIDVMYPCVATKKPVYFIAKRELWDNRLLRWFCNKCRCIPVDRDGSAGDVKAVMHAMKCLKRGDNILIYPEGTRNKTDEPLLPFKGGFAAIAIKTQTPIVPIVQSRKPALFRRAHVVYGKPVEFPEYYGKKLTEENIAECEERVRDIMLEMKQRAESYGKKGKK